MPLECHAMGNNTPFQRKYNYPQLLSSLLTTGLHMFWSSAVYFIDVDYRRFLEHLEVMSKVLRLWPTTIDIFSDSQNLSNKNEYSLTRKDEYWAKATWISAIPCSG